MSATQVFGRALLVGMLTGLLLGLAVGTVVLPLFGSVYGAVVGLVVGIGFGAIEALVLAAATLARAPLAPVVALGGLVALVAALLVLRALDVSAVVSWAVAVPVGALGAALTAPTVVPPRRAYGTHAGRDALVGVAAGAVVGLLRGLTVHDVDFTLAALVGGAGCGALCGLLVAAIAASVRLGAPQAAAS